MDPSILTKSCNTGHVKGGTAKVSEIQAWIAELDSVSAWYHENRGFKTRQGRGLKKIWILMLTKKAPIMIHDVDVSPYDDDYKDAH